MPRRSDPAVARRRLGGALLALLLAPAGADEGLAGQPRIGGDVHCDGDSADLHVDLVFQRVGSAADGYVGGPATVSGAVAGTWQVRTFHRKLDPDKDRFARKQDYSEVVRADGSVTGFRSADGAFDLKLLGPTGRLKLGGLKARVICAVVGVLPW
jgi:hypothetical protein